MTLQEYLNQDPVVRQTTGSVLVEPNDCQVWQHILNSKGVYPEHVIGVHIYAYPAVSYRADPDSGTLYSNNSNGNIEKATVFKIDIKNLNSYI